MKREGALRQWRRTAARFLVPLWLFHGYAVLSAAPGTTVFGDRHPHLATPPGTRGREPRLGVRQRTGWVVWGSIRSPSWDPLGKILNVRGGGAESDGGEDEGKEEESDARSPLSDKEPADAADSGGDVLVADSAAANDGDENSATDMVFGASKSGDGSESDPDGLPSRFLRMQKSDREKAKKAFEHTLAWRAEHHIDTILSRPHPTFDLCKAIFPHYFAGRDIAGNLAIIKHPGKIDLKLSHKNNMTNDDILMHYIYVVEYCWNIADQGQPDGVMTK